jgi:beta-glucosidase
MSRRTSLHALLIAILVLGVVVTGAVAAGKPSTRDRVALRAVKQSQDRATERRIDALLRKMTLEEKLNQLTLLSDGQMKEHPEEARKPVGAVFS